MSKVETLLNFINAFLKGNKLEPIKNLASFSIAKSYLTNKNNVTFFNEQILNEMNQYFPTFSTLHASNLNSPAYMLTILTKLIQNLNNNFNKYKFCVNGEICTISHEQFKPKVHTMCSCLRDAERRKLSREHNETVNCVCGLFQYKNKDETTHMSYNKLTGSFYFPDPTILYDFIVNNKYKNEYIFVEKRTDTTQAYFDIDFKLENHNLAQYIPHDKMEELINHILKIICNVLQNSNYVYCDKTKGYGLHIYFPEVILSKKELGDHTKKVTNDLIENDILNLPKKDNINKKVYKFIVDDICNSGLALLFQEKNGAYYKINFEKSTYPNIPKDPIEQLMLCALRIV